MQNRYTGDVGDFAKYGLLRALARPGERAALRLGLVWHLVPDESHNSDGNHVAYLGPRHGARFRPCDPPLFDAMAALVAAGRRSVAEVLKSRVLGDELASWHEPLAWREGSRRREREERRAAWLAGALAATAGAELVCFDPDNGLEVASHGRYARLGPKYAFVDELGAYAARGQSLVVYQHMNRSAPGAEQCARSLRRLARAVPSHAPPFALRFCAFSARAFLILPARRHERVLRARARQLLGSPWAAHFAGVGC